MKYYKIKEVAEKRRLSIHRFFKDLQRSYQQSSYELNYSTYQIAIAENALFY